MQAVMKRDRKPTVGTVILLVVGIVILTGLVTVVWAQGKNLTEPAIAKEKQTVLGLYLRSKEAFAMWQKEPETVKIIDCRTPEEYVFVGHPPMAYNIPLKFMSYKWDAVKKTYVLEDNLDFLARVQKLCKVTDTILVICRFGTRTAIAVNKLAEAGFKNVFSIVDGFDGELIEVSDLT